MFFGERPTLLWVVKRVLVVVLVGLAYLAIRREFAPPTHLEVTWRMNPQGQLVIDRTEIVPTGATGR